MWYYWRNPRRYAKRMSFNGGRRMPIDVLSDEEGYTIQALVPGMSADDLQIDVLEDLVTLKAVHENGDEAETEGEALLREIDHAGGFYRRLRLPETVEADEVEAKVENGLLTVRLPKSEAVRPKRIEVKMK